MLCFSTKWLAEVARAAFPGVRYIYLWSRIGAYVVLLLAILPIVEARQPTFGLKIKQVTFGPKHHFFGYIGQCQTMPWNSSGRYILGLGIDRTDRVPKPGDVPTVFLIDTYNGNKILRIDETRAWNPQQGTMFYWNPLAAETQFLFNDRDVTRGKVFAVLYDIEEKRRLRESGTMTRRSGMPVWQRTEPHG